MIHHRIVYSATSYHRITISRAEGSRIWDEHGKSYIDFTSGWNVTNLGWNHPEVADAMAAQLAKNAYVPMWGADPIQQAYAERLTAALQKPLDACVRTTGGTEANEVSIKIARAATGRKKVIGFKGSYHGQLFASMALCFPPEATQAIGPLVPEFVQIDFPMASAGEGGLQRFRAELEALLARKDVAALVAEAGVVTGPGTCYVSPPGFLAAARELTREYGTLLIVDEVGTGFSRTGKLFGIEHEGVVPDLVCFAKPITNGGAAMGAVVGSSQLIEPTIPLVNLTSTFGWTPVACAAALKSIEIHQRERVWEQAHAKGAHALTKLRTMLVGHPLVADIRGVGLEMGVELKQAPLVYRKLSTGAAERGLHLAGDESANVIQLMPPLTISQTELDEGLDVFISVLSRMG